MRRTLTTFPDDRTFVMRREIAAPRALVWRAWSEPAIFAAWYGAKTVAAAACEIDFRVGGRYRIDLCDEAGRLYPLSGAFLRIEPPARIVMTDEIDAGEPDWSALLAPHRNAKGALIAILDITLEEADAGTLMTVSSRFDAAADCAAMLKIGAEAGWAQSFDKMDAALASSDQ